MRDDTLANESELIRLSQDGCLESFGILCKNYWPRLLACISPTVRNPNESEDVLQIIFIDVSQNITRFDSRRSAFSSWIIRIAHHKAVDYVRRSEVQKKTKLAFAQQQENDPYIHNPEEPIDWNTIRVIVQAIVQTFSKNQSDVLTLALEGLTQPQISKRLKLPLGTVKTHINRGMQLIRAHPTIQHLLKSRRL